MCCCCVGLLLLISCEVLLPLLRLAPDCCDEELGEKELFDILTFSDDVGETEMKKIINVKTDGDEWFKKCHPDYDVNFAIFM